MYLNREIVEGKFLVVDGSAFSMEELGLSREEVRRIKRGDMAPLGELYGGEVERDLVRVKEGYGVPLAESGVLHEFGAHVYQLFSVREEAEMAVEGMPTY